MAKKKSYHTIDELLEQQRQNAFSNFSVGDNKEYHTIDEIKKAATEQGLLTERAPVTQPSAQTTSGRRNLMIRNNQIKNDSRQWKQNQVDGSNPFDLRNQVYKTQNETIPRIAQQAASDYVKNRMGYNYISQYGDDTRYSDVSNDISRVQQLKGGAARRGKDTEVYDRALDMLKDYASYNRNLAETMTVDEVRAKKNESTDQKDQDRENYTWLANYNNGDIIAQDAKEGEQNRLKAEQLTQYFKDQYGIDNVSLENAVDFGSKSRSSDIAYFDEDGEAVTWDNYLRIKSAETKLNDISNNKDVNDIYSKNVTDYDDINQIDKAIDMVNLSFSDATDNNTPTISTDEQRAITAYLSDKYNIDFSKDVNDVLTDLNNVRAEVENQFESDRESLSQAGYDWEELNYYNQYVKDKEEYQRRKAENEQFATEHPVAATLSSIAVAPAKVFDLAQNVAESFKSNDADETSALGLSNIYNDYNVNTANQYTSKVSQNINESVKESTNSDVLAWLASNSYSGISSSAQSAMTNAACVAMFGPQAGEVVALGLMGTEAAADGFNNAVRNGSNNKEALFSALATGVNEVMFEKLSFDHLMKMKGNLDTKSLKGFVKSALKSSPEMLVQGLVEADEEVNTDIANTITDYIINGNHSEYNNSIERYISQGYSKEEAEKLASEDKWKQLLESAYGGFIGGATAGSGKVAVNTAKAAVNSVSNRAERNQYIRNVGEDVTGAGNAQALLDRAAQIDDPAVKAQAQRTQQALDKANQNSTKSTNNRLSRETGKLYAAMQDSTAQGIQNAEANEIKAAIKSAYAAETGETDSSVISKAADAIYKSEYTDERLTRSERNLAETAAAQSALESVKNNPDLIESATQKAQERGFRDYVETAKLTQKQETKTDDDVDIAEFNYHEDDGKVYTSDGKKQVDIASVASIGDNDITFALNDGQTESAKALDMPTNQAVLAQSILDVQKKIGVPLTADIANTLYQGYEQSDSPSVSAYMQDAQTVLFNGYANNTAPDSSINLPQELRNQLYRMGRQLAASHTQVQQQNVNARVKDNKSRKGTVSFQDGINRNRLDPRRRAGVDAVEHLAQSLGFDVVFYRSTKDGKGRFSSEYVRKNKFVADGQQAPSGFWRGGKMYLDINAGMNGEGLILFTASHELVHMIREGSPEDFKALSDFLVQNYAEQGVDINDLVRKEMARSTNLTRDQALEEVIAESCETFLRDTTLNDKAQELYKQNPTLWSRIREALKRIVDAVKQWYAVAKPQSEEARITMRAGVETLENAYDLWTKGIIKSAENLRNMESERTDTKYQGRAEAQDTEYLDAVERGDMETAQRMVDEAAKAAGYNTPMLYHGTQNFGFTQFDLNKMDDKMSIFLTSTPETASTYSGVTGKRGISEKYFNKNLFDMSANELVKTANQFINEREKGRDIEYRYYTKNDLLKMADEVQDGLSRLKEVAKKVGPEYANKAMRGFDDSALRAHTIINNMLNDIKNGESYNWIGAAINQLANETDEFNTSEFKKLSDTLFVLGEIQDSGILRAGEEEAILRVRPDLLLYEYESNVRVAHELQKKMSRGNYATYAKLDNPLIIDAKGARWNQIPITDQMWDSLTRLQKGWDKQGNKISYTRSIAAYAKEHGYDGVVFKNLEDNGGLNDLVHTAKSDVYVVFNPSQVKSADPVTYDDNGDVIPLSERFNESNNDIRYQSRNDDLFSTDDMFDDDSISSTVAREYITHHEDIGEVLKNIADIELPSSKVQSIVNRVIRNELGYLDEEARRTLSIELQLALERVSKTDAQDVSNEMINAVRKAVEGARITDERTQASYQELRNVFKGKKYFLSDEQINQLKEHDMTFDDFRKAMFGKVTIVKRENAKRSINGGYADAQQLSLEGLHDLLDNPEEVLGIRRDEWDNKNYDAPYIIKNAFDTLREQQSQLVTDMYSDEAIDDMAIAIAAKITGDIVEAKYNSRKNPYVSKLVKDLQAKRTEAVNRQKERNKQKLAELKTKERERAEKREKELTEHYKEQRAKNVQKRNLTKQKDVVARKLRSLDKKLNRSNKDKTVKEGLRPTAAKLLEVGNMLFPETRSLEEMAREGVSDATPAEKKLLDKYVTYLDMRERSTTKEQRESMSNMLSYIRKRLSKEGIPVEVTENGKTVKKKMSVTARERMRYDNSMREYNKLKLRTALTELEDAYSMVRNSPDGYIADSFDPTIIDLIKDLKNDVGDTLAKDMTSAQLQTLNDIVTRALKSITNANKLFLQSKSMTDTAAAVMNDIKHIRKLKDMRNLPMYKAGEFLGWTNFKPIYAMRFIGSDTLTQLYWNIQRGESNWYVDIAEAKEFKDKLDEKYGVGKLNTKNKTDFNYNKKATFTALDGSEFTLNLDQMMDIYAASRRKQALQHLLKGGFTFAKDAKGDKFGTLKTGAKVYQLTAETISNIADQLTVNEKKYVEDMQKYLSTVMADKGNEVSMQLHGVKLFNEEIYWSISSTDIYAPQNEVDQEQKTDLVKKIRNAGFTKSTVKNASNPIVVQGFEEKWAGHVNEMSLYHAMTLPLEDFTKVVNYRERGKDAKATTGVRGVLNQAYGNAASNYINQLIDDLNGGIQQRMRVGVADTLVSLAKKGAVLTNLSVVIQQPSAMFRAMAYINPRYFVKATGNKFWSFEDKRFSWTKHNKAYEELIKYAPIAGIKRMGSFDTGAGRGVIDYLSSGGRENLAQRAYRKSDDIASFMPEYADELAWIKIWQAVQHETQARYGYKVGTEQNKIKSGERFTEVVHLTQVYDSTLSRSHAMRGKDFGSKMLTSFMAEPTTYMNMAVDAVVQAKRTGNQKQRRKVFFALGMALVANALLVAIPRAMRDDDEEETFADKYLQAFWSDIVSGVNPLNYFPILKDIMSTIEGHSNERMDMTIIGNVISSITKAFDNIQKGKFSGDDVINIIGAAAACVGFSFKNLVRDIRSVINTVNTFKNAHYFKEVDEMGLSLPYAYQKAYDEAWNNGYSEEECKSKAEAAARSEIANALKSKYLEAVETNDTDSADEIRQYMLQSGYYHSKKKNGTDLDAVKETLNSWREKNSEASERANTAEERQKSE